ncbi:hypothetical protein EB077_12515, partial [bacterium]|nr:hypothetical protein [bacterium]
MPGFSRITYQDTLGAGTTVLYTCPTNVTATIGTVRFNNPAAYNITFTVNRANPVSSVDAYTFTLAAGDVVVDSTGYQLKFGDSIQVTTS